MSIELMMPSNHLILFRPLLLLPSICPRIRVFSNQSVLRIRWPKYRSFGFSIILAMNIQHHLPKGQVRFYFLGQYLSLQIRSVRESGCILSSLPFEALGEEGALATAGPPSRAVMRPGPAAAARAKKSRRFLACPLASE